jgi:hypothetical protein
MKNCFLVTILFLGLAFNGNSTTASSNSVFNRNFNGKLQQYIKEQKSKAQSARSFSWLPFSGYALDCGSWYYEKGNSVDKNEIELLTKISDADYEKAIAQQDTVKIQMLAQEIVSKIKYEKDVNKWHDQLYDLISQHNDPGVPRKEALKKKLAHKDDPIVQQQFVFGIAVTMTVEEMMKAKK